MFPHIHINQSEKQASDHDKKEVTKSWKTIEGNTSKCVSWSCGRLTNMNGDKFSSDAKHGFKMYKKIGR